MEFSEASDISRIHKETLEKKKKKKRGRATGHRQEWCHWGVHFSNYLTTPCPARGLQLDACCFFRGPWSEERKVRKTSSTPCARHTKKSKKKKKKQRETARRIWWEEEQCVLWQGSMLQYSVQDVANWEQMRGGDASGAPWPGYTERTGAQRHADQRTKGFCCLRTLFCSVTWRVMPVSFFIKPVFLSIIITWLLSKLPQG